MSRSLPPSAAGAALADDHIDLTADEIGRQRGQPIIVPFRPAIFDGHVLTLDITDLAHPLTECGHASAHSGRAMPLVSVADHRHPLPCALAGGCRTIPRPAKDQNIAPVHSLPQALLARGG